MDQVRHLAVLSARRVIGPGTTEDDGRNRSALVAAVPIGARMLARPTARGRPCLIQREIEPGILQAAKNVIALAEQFIGYDTTRLPMLRLEVDPRQLMTQQQPATRSPGTPADRVAEPQEKKKGVRDNFQKLRRPGRSPAETNEGVSHGELIRDGVDQTLSIDPCQPLRFLYQGLDMEENRKYEYIELPYRLGVITAATPNAISELCRK